MSLNLFENIDSLLSLRPAYQKAGRKIVEADLDIIQKAAILTRKGRIEWIGPKGKIPKRYFSEIKKQTSLQGRTVTPGLVEAHTHTVFAGDRASEFELRNQGTPYLEIAKRGGGILSTMRATRKASASHLSQLTQQRVDLFIEQGVTTLEIKSGYGLSLKDELKLLRVAESMQGPQIVTTFLGAHAKPPEFNDHESYLNFLQAKVLPEVKKKTNCRRVDIFTEKGFFEKPMSRKYLQTAQELGFAITIHGDQLTLSGGSELAFELGAKSVDHVIQVDDKVIHDLAKSATTAVLLPMADLYMKCSYPPARKLIDAGARVALATDFNPGSSPSQDVQLVGLLARLQMGMSLPEVLAAYTVGAAFSLGLENQIGHLDIGWDANFTVWDCDWTQLFYSAGARPANAVYRFGKKIK